MVIVMTVDELWSFGAHAGKLRPAALCYGLSNCLSSLS